MAKKIIQLFFKDDRHFTFRKMPLQHSCFIEKDGERFKKAWKHFYGCEIPFRGYKNISAGAVTLGFERDIILDLFGKVPVSKDPTNPSLSEKPDIKTDSSLKNWLAKVATNMRFIYRAKRGTETKINWIVLILGCVLGIMIIGWLVAFLT